MTAVTDETTLFRLLYRSANALTGSTATVEAELEEILALSRENNRRAGLTGALILSHAGFLQVLEGPRRAVEETFERICCDLRHRDVELVEFSPAEARAFEGWDMARAQADGAVERLLSGVGGQGTSTGLAQQAHHVVRLMQALVTTAAASGKATAAGLVAA